MFGWTGVGASSERGSCDGGTDTNAPKSESAEPGVHCLRGCVVGSDESAATSVGVAGGVAGKKSVAKRSMSASLGIPFDGKKSVTKV